MKWILPALVLLTIAGIFAVRRWTPPPKAQPYLPDIYAAERAHALPVNLLARLIDEESKYREDIISGDVKSRAGAVGIAQIVPKWHPGVNPLDPIASIYYAAKYLRELFNQFRPRVDSDVEGWRLALAGYNWGPGNLNRDLADQIIGNEWPTETRNYVSSIMADIPVQVVIA